MRADAMVVLFAVSALAAASWQLMTRGPLEQTGSAIRASAIASIDAAPLSEEPVSRTSTIFYCPSTLLIPVAGVSEADLIDSYNDVRGDGRTHHAIDIPSPAGTEVRAVDDGRIAKLFLSKPGGITLYQFDPSERFAYYYAHLERYAEGIEEGKILARGELIGYVGFTGNADPSAPHLHFEITKLGADKRWWQGTPINPYALLGGTQR